MNQDAATRLPLTVLAYRRDRLLVQRVRHAGALAYRCPKQIPQW
jgi:hypothetical protein